MWGKTPMSIGYRLAALEVVELGAREIERQPDQGVDCAAAEAHDHAARVACRQERERLHELNRARAIGRCRHLGVRRAEQRDLAVRVER
jgi:hypothetical protein